MKEVHDLLLRQRLLHHEAEEDDVAELPEIVEELRARVRVLHDVLQRGLVVPEDSLRCKTGLEDWYTWLGKSSFPRLHEFASAARRRNHAT